MKKLSKAEKARRLQLRQSILQRAHHIEDNYTPHDRLRDMAFNRSYTDAQVGSMYRSILRGSYEDELYGRV